jgi:LmbE family N-acetylglucosaminyl deacetylase
MAEWIYLSPHFDDAAFSCGGLIWQQTQAGARVSVWTVCAGEPPPGNLSPFAAFLHARWESGSEAVRLRREEDAQSNRILGAGYHHLPVPDCIYRKSPSGETIYPSENSLFGELDPRDELLVDELAAAFSNLLEAGRYSRAANIVSPLALGGHVDHQLVRRAVEAWVEGYSDLHLWYYADFPYSLQIKGLRSRQEVRDMEEFCSQISTEALDAWFRASAAHASQISTFWKDKAALRRALEEYLAENDGVCLWKWGKSGKNRP